jgi:hypothetical protein
MRAGSKGRAGFVKFPAADEVALDKSAKIV